MEKKMVKDQNGQRQWMGNFQIKFPRVLQPSAIQTIKIVTSYQRDTDLFALIPSNFL